jgi:hypothetical protein
MVMTVDLRFIEDAQLSLPSSALFGMAFSLEQLAAVQ